MSRLKLDASSLSATALLAILALAVGRLKTVAATRPQTGDVQCRSCPLSATAPMCDADGILYPNECVARCQGITGLVACTPSSGVAVESALLILSSTEADQEGSTPTRLAAPGQFLPEARRVTDGSVTWEVMNRLADQGFRFLGQFQLMEGPPATLQTLDQGVDPITGAQTSTSSSNSSIALEAATADEEEDQSAASQESSQDASAVSGTVNREVHVTFPEGYVYSRAIANVSREATPPSQGGAASLGARLRRSVSRRLLQTLGIFGADQRAFRSPLTGWPASAVLLLAFKKADGSGPYVCTGTLISPSAILTAGHCVFTPNQGAHMNFEVLTGAPYYGGAASPALVNGLPVTVVGVRTLSLWTTSKDYSNDAAVLLLGQKLGAELGWLGTAPDDCISILSHNPVATYGYPVDKYGGSQWGMSGCSISASESPRGCDQGGVLRHDCDIQHGQSGSAITDAGNVVRGVISFAQTGQLNGAPWLGGDVWAMVQSAVNTTSSSS